MTNFKRSTSILTLFTVVALISIVTSKTNAQTTLACGQTCTGGNQCATGFCSIGVCRNPVCPTDADCNCENDYCKFSGTGSYTTAFANATIQGSVYLAAGDVCSSAAGIAAISTVRLRQTGPGTCTGPGSYDNTVTASSYNFNDLTCFDGSGEANFQLTVTYADPTYSFRCEGTNSNVIAYNIAIKSGDTRTIDSKLVTAGNAWLQSYGTGEIYASNVVSLNIPPTATDKRLIRSDASMGAGVVIVGGSDIALGSGYTSDKGWAKKDYTINLPEESSYDQIYRKFVTAGLVDETTSADVLNQPTAVSQDTYIIHATNEKVTIPNDWKGINQPIIVITDGTLIISANISLDTNGFLMIIAKSNVFVSDTVGTSNHADTTPQLEGLFIAGENFEVLGTGDPATDKRLNISGGVVTGATGSSGTYISARSNSDNFLYPTDYFIFNPKLIINAPREITEPIYTWSETR